MTNLYSEELSWNEIKKLINLEEIQTAALRLKDIVPATPVSRSIYNSNKYKSNIWFKLENFNVTGSFKIRGAANALKKADPSTLSKGVVAASAGNHAQGVAYISKRLGVKATIFMPERTPIVKVEATRGHGANVVLKGAVYDDAYATAKQQQQLDQSTLIHAFADSDVINGQGTVGLELLQQIDNLGAIIVPIGGGGLASGIACAVKSLKPDILVIGVQTAAFASMKTSFSNNVVTTVAANQTIADGIAVKRPSQATLALCKHYLDDLVVVSEDEIAAAIMSLMEKDHLLAEGAGAASVAALADITPKISEKIGDKKICCIVSGGNIDVPLLSRIATRGLIASGRMMRLKMYTKDQPGKLADILKSIGDTGANLIDVRHNRAFGAMYYSDVELEMDLETVDFAHQERIREKINQLGLQLSQP